MSIDVYSKALKEKIQVGRIIGHVAGKNPGPTVIFIGGIHGNEPAGVFALKNVCDALENMQVDFSGNFYALTGNQSALQKQERYIEVDLNRIWTHNHIKKIQNGVDVQALTQEQKEQKELYSNISSILTNESGPFYFFDLHTTSSSSSPFIATNDTLANRTFSQLFPVPTVLGIEEYLKGPLLSYINEFGYVSLGFEAGQHDDLSSIDYHTAFIWLAMCFSGFIPQQSVPEFETKNDLLKKHAKFGRRIFDIREYYRIDEQEQFTMNPGFSNFSPIREGKVLAKNENGPICSGMDGLIFMPLYQKQGEDGYFIIREIPPFWLTVSAKLRKYNFDRLITLLPGIRQLSSPKESIRVNKKIVRLFASDFFHLIGYRKLKEEKKYIYFSKRETKISRSLYNQSTWANW